MLARGSVASTVRATVADFMAVATTVARITGMGTTDGLASVDAEALTAAASEAVMVVSTEEAVSMVAVGFAEALAVSRVAVGFAEAPVDSIAVEAAGSAVAAAVDFTAVAVDMVAGTGKTSR